VRKEDIMKIGVTGATGQLGRLVVKGLLTKTSAGNCVALVRLPRKAADLGVEAREFDYTKPENLAHALQGIDTLLLI
jgi:NAD(P)H dehydrogenase (quinone)